MCLADEQTTNGEGHVTVTCVLQASLLLVCSSGKHGPVMYKP